MFNDDSMVETVLEHLNLVFIGHVDHGKSTLCGRILLDLGLINDRIVQKCKQKAKENHLENWWIAYIMDEDPEEQGTGTTRDFASGRFHSSKKRYTILDAPGHKNYVPMMMDGTSQADVAILVVSARKNEFEAGFQKSGQTREHIILAKTIGVKHLIVVVNKMDDSTVNWDQKRFKYIADSVKTFLNQVGFPRAPIIPISGFSGINVANENITIPNWYTGSSLLKTLDSLPPLVRDVTSPVVISVSSSSLDDGRTYIIGKVLMGKVTLRQSLTVLPSQNIYHVTGLFLQDDCPSAEEARAGDNLRITLDGTEVISKGSVLCADKNSVVIGSSFLAELQLLQLPTSAPIMTAGYKVIAHVGNSVVEAEVKKIAAVWDKNKNVTKNPKFVKSNTRVGVHLELTKKVPLNCFTTLPDLGRITLRLGNETIAFGKVVKCLAS
jgi:peptide chain release factor subunit 3